MHTRFRSGVLVLAAGIILNACARGTDGPDAGETARAADEGMRGMPGMGASGMMEQMQSHMEMMEGAGADSMMAMLPMHRQMVANMISQFNREMRQMNMEADAAWQAMTDSLRQDNIRMREMSPSELRAFMPQHRARVVRLMAMHRSMMGTMKM